MTRRRRREREPLVPRPDPPRLCSGCGLKILALEDYWADGRGGHVHTWCRPKKETA